MRVNFYLRDDRKKSTREDDKTLLPIFVRSRVNSPTLVKRSTGLQCTAKAWKKNRGGADITEKLNALERQIIAEYSRLSAKGMRPTLLHCWPKSAESVSLSIVEHTEVYLKKSTDSEGQKHNVRTMVARLKDFDPDLHFAQLDKNTLRDFVDHMNEQGIANNSAYKSIRALSVVAEYAGLDAVQFKMKNGTRNAEPARLDSKEVAAILSAETTTSLERIALDVFGIACWTGLRIGDILTLQEGTLTAWYYERVMGKTKKPVFVTIHDRNRSLLAQYIDSGIPYSRQKLSDALHEVLKRVTSLDVLVTHVKLVGAKAVKTSKPKHELISFHSGRRYYASLLSALGLPVSIIGEELGHEIKGVTEHYVGGTEHKLRIHRVRTAIAGMETTLAQLDALMIAI